MNLRTKCLGLSLLAMATGCHAIQDTVSYTRYHTQAKLAWHHHKPVYKAHGVERPFLTDFGEGWKKGFYDTLQGGSGVMPVVAPPKYWGSHYETPAGHAAQLAWFDGYAEGAMVAKTGGGGNWTLLPVSAPYQVDISSIPPQYGTQGSSIQLHDVQPAEEVPSPPAATPSEDLPAVKPESSASAVPQIQALPTVKPVPVAPAQ